MLRRSRIAEAAVDVLASHGVAGLTHRLVAARAGVSLAATTYYFDNKHHIIAEASGIILRDYTRAFRRAAERVQQDANTPGALGKFVHRLIRRAARRDRLRTLCWAEIMLDAHRHQESLALARDWFSNLETLWQQIATAARVRQPIRTARSAVDLVIGLLFMTLALGLDEAQVDAVLVLGNDPSDAWGLAELTGQPQPPAVTRSTRKSAQTSERILAATVELLIADGPGAVTYHNIAAKAGLAPAAPLYHFPTIGSVLAAAQQRLFETAKARYRDAAVAAQAEGSSNVERLIDRTAAVFIREATEFAPQNLAAYAIWLEAAREAQLRPLVCAAIADQQLAWQRVMARVTPSYRPSDALAAQASFIGRLIRVLATGSATDDLAAARAEFAYDLNTLARARFWF